MRAPFLRPFSGALLQGTPLASANSQQGSGSLASHLIDRHAEVSDPTCLPPQDAQRELQQTLQGERRKGSPSWCATPELIKESIKYILETQLSGDPKRISTGKFTSQKFRLRDGSEVSGDQVISAVAQFERPGLTKGEAIRALGGKAAIVTIIKKKYLGWFGWAETKESLRETIQYIFETHLDRDSGRISTSDRFARTKFRLADGIEVSGEQVIHAVAQRERPHLSKIKAVRALGGRAAIAALIKEQYLDWTGWAETKESLRETVQYIFETHLDRDPGRIAASTPFGRHRFRLADGTEVSGIQLISAVAQRERPHLSKKKAIRTLGGTAAVVALLKKQYLDLELGDRQWETTKESLQETIQYILGTHLDGDPERIHAGTEFVRGRFRLRDGTEASGRQIINVAAKFERPNLSKTKAVRSLGGLAEIVALIKKNYLGLELSDSRWAETKDSLRETIQYILKTHLGGDPERISTSASFMRSRFRLRDRTEVSGIQIIHTVAQLERPDLSKREALRALGRASGVTAAVVTLIKKQYLGLELSENYWAETKDSLLATIQYILKTHLGGDPERISTSVSFVRSRFRLRDGTEVSGIQVIHAVAQIERPNLARKKAIRALGGGAAVAALIKKQYLGLELSDSRWAETKESLQEAIQYILETHLDRDPGRIYAGTEFIRGQFRLRDGTEASGGQIIRAVAHLEKPDLSKVKAVRALGGSAAVVAIIKEKYLGIVDFKKSSPNALQEFIRKNNLQEICERFRDDPALLIEMLSFLKAKEFENQDVIEFVKAYVGLGVERKPGKPKSEAENSWEKRRAFIRAILQAIESAQELDLSEENLARQLRNLIRLSRLSFQADPSALINEFKEQAAAPLPDFVRRLNAEAAAYFEAIHHFKIRGMTTELYGYQIEGVRFLATHAQAILADEAGMGKTIQAIAAVESLELKRVLWITTASNKESVQEEILAHSKSKKEDIKIVISGNPRERRQQLAALNGERYVITNYETLVALKKNDPKAYKKLTTSLDLVIADEAQMADNPDALRTKAVQAIPAPRRWLLTATPYQNKPESIFTLLNWLSPKEYTDKKAFENLYTKSTEGLILLHSKIAGLMLRRRKQHTLEHFEDETECSFAEQLADGIPRIPKKRPTQSRHYELSHEQADLIAWMTADFKGWATYFNENLSNGAEPINIDNINAFQKFSYVHKVIYQPEYFGITTPNPLFEQLDAVTAARLANGEKLIQWGWNTSVVKTIEERYASLGVRRIDGSVLGQKRVDARVDFQDDPNVRILAGNYVSGGVGLTLTAANTAIFAQLPLHWPPVYQAEGRHHRLIGINKVQHAKEYVDVEWMVPQFPEGFVEGIKDEKLIKILKQGTLVEQTRARLQGGEVLYNMMLEGYGKLEDLEEYFKSGVIKGMGLTGDEKLDYVSHLKGETRTYAEVIQRLLPLWHLIQGNEGAEEQVLQIIDAFKNYPAYAAKLGDAFREAAEAYPEDLDFILKLFRDVKNKFIRDQIFKYVPDLIVKIYGQGTSLTEAAQGLQVGRLTPASFLAQIYTASNEDNDVVLNVTRELAKRRDTPSKRYIEEHFFMGVLGLIGNKDAEALLAAQESLFAEASLADQVHGLYRLGLLARTRSDLVTPLVSTSYDSWESLAKALETEVHTAIAEFAGQPIEAVYDVIAQSPDWHGNADPLLALMAGWQDADEVQLLDQFKEVLWNLFSGDYQEWRYSENDREHGNSIEYLSDKPQFWKDFANNHVSSLDEVSIASSVAQTALIEDYMVLRQEVDLLAEAVEGPWVKGEIDAYRRLTNSEAKSSVMAAYQQELQQLGKLLGKGEITDAGKALLEKYQLSVAVNLSSKAELKQKIEELNSLLGWMMIDDGFEAIGTGQEVDKAMLIRKLELRANYYRTRHYEKTAEHMDTLQTTLRHWQSGELRFNDITIEDTATVPSVDRMIPKSCARPSL